MDILNQFGPILNLVGTFVCLVGGIIFVIKVILFMRKKLYEGFCDINEMVAPTAALIITLLLGGILQIITSDKTSESAPAKTNEKAPPDFSNELKEIPRAEYFEYDGGGYTITGLNSPLFGRVSGSLIQNVNIFDSVIETPYSNNYGFIVNG